MPASPTPSPTAAPERLPRDIVVLIGAALIVALGFGLIAPILPSYAQSFGVSNAAAAAIVSVFAATRLLFAPLSGRVTERWGEPLGYVSGVLIVAASTIACAFANDYWSLIAFRALGGIGSTLFTVSAASFIARRSPAALRGRIAGLYGGAFLIGNVAGPLVGGLLSPLGYRAPFLIYGVALVIAAAVVYVFLVGVTGQLRAKEAAASLPPLTLREAWATQTYRAAMIGNFGHGWVTFGVRTSLVPLFAAGALGMNAFEVGLVLTVFAVGNAVALSFSGRWSDRVGRRLPIVIGMSLAALTGSLLGLSPDAWVLIALSLLSGLGTGLFGPAQQATIADTVGPHHSAGRVMAAFQMAADLPAIAAPLVAGYLSDHWGYGPAFAISGVIMALGVVAWLRVRPSNPSV
ncbi:MAG: MFS transporter [Arthrobacter sp.]|jgi:MFS family permease|nr:MFS transporter [Arthrobacter sp.]